MLSIGSVLRFRLEVVACLIYVRQDEGSMLLLSRYLCEVHQICGRIDWSISSN